MHKLTLFSLILISFQNLTASDFIEPEWRGAASTEFAHWDRFTSASGPNSPDIQADTPSRDARLTCTSPSAFVTSSGNLYSFNSGISVQLDDSANYAIQSVLLQVRTLGGELDPQSVRIIAPDATGQPYIALPSASFTLSDDDLPSGEQTGGQVQVQVFQFDFSELPMIGTYSILFSSSGSSMSLDQVMLDTASTAQSDVGRAPQVLPKLRLEMDTSSQLSLRYSKAAPAGVKVQTATDLEALNPWSDLEITPTTDGDDWLIRLPVESDFQFFRLIKP